MIPENFAYFQDKKGKYAEVIAVLSDKIGLLGFEETCNLLVPDVSKYNIGDLVYFDKGNKVIDIISPEVKTVTSSTSNRQSPNCKMIDPNSRY